eukprot:8671114-Prorocentrum_lima.AAC.1
MTSSLVGSEMCIRDRWYGWGTAYKCCVRVAGGCHGWDSTMGGTSPGGMTVSYTHLTLPTICSV